MVVCSFIRDIISDLAQLCTQQLSFKNAKMLTEDGITYGRKENSGRSKQVQNCLQVCNRKVNVMSCKCWNCKLRSIILIKTIENHQHLIKNTIFSYFIISTLIFTYMNANMYSYICMYKDNETCIQLNIVNTLQKTWKVYQHCFLQGGYVCHLSRRVFIS